jgi:DNA-binding PadR family transcriptional regulator
VIDRDFVLGFVKLYVLWRASREAVYGLQILDEMRDLGFHLSPGTIYPALHALHRERDVSVRKSKVQGKIRKCYRTTPKGRKELAQVKDRLGVLLRAMFR